MHALHKAHLLSAHTNAMSQAWLCNVGDIAVSLIEEIIILVTLIGVVECYGIVLKSGKKIEVD